MSKIVKVTYDATSLKTTITINGAPFDTSRIDGKEIADWAYPFMLRKVKWDGFYDEMVSALGGEKEFNLLFEGPEEDLNELKEAWEDAPVTIISEEATGNIAVITYDERTLSTTIMVNGETFDTSRINGREIADWVYPFMMRKVKWDGIFEELAKVIGSEEYVIQFSGTEAALKELMEECPDTVHISFQNTSNSVETADSCPSKCNDFSDNELKWMYEYIDNFQNCSERDTVKEKQIFETLSELVESSDAMAQFYLGNCYINGIGVDVDEQTGFEWKKKAASAGLAIAQSDVGFAYQYAVYDFIEQNFDTAFEWYSKAANQNLAHAQILIASMYEHGSGVDQDSTLAFEWYMKAANQKDSAGLCCAGECYETGFGIEMNLNKAFQFYYEAAEMGDSFAECEVGRCYENGIGVQKSTQKAFEWYMKATKHKNSNEDSAYALGRCYEYGIGTSKNIEEALKWYSMAAESDLEDAEEAIVRLTNSDYSITDDEDESFEKNVSTVPHLSSTHDEEANSEYQKGMQYHDNKDYTKGFIHFQNANQKGHPEAKLMVGKYYYIGYGMPKNYPAAFSYFSEAAEFDLPEAQFYLGLCYDCGNGVATNDALAVKWYQKAVDHNYAEAQNHLGAKFLVGSGVPINEKKAFELFKLSAKQGITGAQARLADCYAEGTGTIENVPMAYYWYSKAAESELPYYRAMQKKETIEKNDPLCILRIPLDETPEEPELLRWVSDSNLMHITIKGKSIFSHFDEMLSKLLKCSKNHREGHYRELNGIIDLFDETTLFETIDFSEQTVYIKEWEKLYPKLSVIDQYRSGINRVRDHWESASSFQISDSSKYITHKANMPLYLVCFLQDEIKKTAKNKGYDSWHTTCNDYISRLEILKSEIYANPSESVRYLQILFQNLMLDGTINEEHHMYITLIDVMFSNYLDEINTEYNSITDKATSSRQKFGLLGRLIGPSDGEIAEKVKSRIQEMAYKLYLFFICKCFILSEFDKMCDEDDSIDDDNFFDNI